MFITVDWSLLGNLRAREGGAVKFFQIRQATLASTRVKLGETVPRDFVEDQRRGRMSWKNSYSKKLPALTSLRTYAIRTLVESRSLRLPRVRSVKRPATTARRGRFYSAARAGKGPA